VSTGRAEAVGLGLILAAAVLWGMLGVFSAGLLRLGVGPVEIAFWRALFGGAAFLAHALMARRWRSLTPRGWLATMAFAAFGVSLFYVSLVRAIDLGGVSLAFVLLYTAPAWVVLLAGPVLGERATPVQWALVGVSVAGVALVSAARGAGIDPSPAALAWGLTAGLTYASYYLWGKRLLARQAPVQLYGLALPLGALGIAPFVSWSAKPPAAWALLVAAALVSTYAAYLLYGLGLTRAASSRAVLVATVEPIVAGALAWAVFGERMGPLGLVGAALVIVAAAGSGVPVRRRPRARVRGAGDA
jgi:drug/metabolite transporter (DMT)-like permease